jgi:hypothetical protein
MELDDTAKDQLNVEGLRSLLRNMSIQHSFTVAASRKSSTVGVNTNTTFPATSKVKVFYFPISIPTQVAENAPRERPTAAPKQRKPQISTTKFNLQDLEFDSGMRGLTHKEVLDALSNTHYASNACKPVPYNVKSGMDQGLYIRLNWHNAMFFGTYATGESFICKYNKFRGKYIEYVKAKSLEGHEETVTVERIGSESCVSDVDLSLSPIISDVNDINQLTVIAHNIIHVFEKMYDIHTEFFDDSFEVMFDTNVYATAFCLSLDKDCIDTIAHGFNKKEVNMKYKIYIDPSSWSPEICNSFDLSQTLFAVRRIIKYNGTQIKLPRNVGTCIQKFDSTTVINTIRNIIPDGQKKFELLFKECYFPGINEVNDIDIIGLYSSLIKMYYTKFQDAWTNSSSTTTIHNIPNILSCATLMEKDSYHSMGAFMDVVAFGSLSVQKKHELLPSYMLNHSILDNLGFIIEILIEHMKDPCYTETTNILKISKYIERICKAIEAKYHGIKDNAYNEFNKGFTKEQLQFVVGELKQAADTANQARKNENIENAAKEDAKKTLLATIHKQFTTEFSDSNVYIQTINMLLHIIDPFLHDVPQHQQPAGESVVKGGKPTRRKKSTKKDIVHTRAKVLKQKPKK